MKEILQMSYCNHITPWSQSDVELQQTLTKFRAVDETHGQQGAGTLLMTDKKPLLILTMCIVGLLILSTQNHFPKQKVSLDVW